MLGINRLSAGRIGNRLFHYNFLRQISKKTEIDYFHIEFPEKEYFEEMSMKSRRRLNFHRPVEVSSRDVVSIPPDHFLEFVLTQKKNNKDVLFSPPMLGETFFDYLYYDPNEFIKIKSKFKKNSLLNSTDDVVKIGLHFRGTDFESWNEKAALKLDYYQTAICFCQEYFINQELIFSLFTDDLEYPAYKQTLSYIISEFKQLPILGETNKPPVYDLFQMSQSDVLISSPSTFAIFAGILGKKKLIIHNKKWVNYCVEKKDTFWVRLVETTNPFYNLWKTF